MSERESWMPASERLCMAFDLADQAWDEIHSDEREGDWLDPLRALIRAAVEKALAEHQAVYLRDFQGWKEQEEARHAREIEKARLEAKIEAIAEMEFVCICDGPDDLCPVCSYKGKLAAALAALEVKGE